MEGPLRDLVGPLEIFEVHFEIWVVRREMWRVHFEIGGVLLEMFRVHWEIWGFTSRFGRNWSTLRFGRST